MIPNFTVLVNGHFNIVVLRESQFQAKLKLLMIGRCFYWCRSLEEVIFADDSKLRHIGKEAFKWSGLKKITIPSGVETLDNEFFSGCKSLEEVIFANDCKHGRIGKEKKLVAEDDSVKEIDVSDESGNEEWLLDIGHYREIKTLGRGTFGEVKLYEENGTTNKVAVKFR